MNLIKTNLINDFKNLNFKNIEKRDVALILLILFFSFQRALMSLCDPLRYADEILAIYAGGVIAWKYYKTKKIKNNDKYVIILMVALLVEGLISNILSQVLGNLFAICIDILSIFKVFICYLWIKEVECDKDVIIINLARIGRIIVYTMVVCRIISQFFDIGMNYRQVRLGIRSFEFIFNNAGNFSKYFYFLIPLLTADLKYESNKYKIITILFACLAWLSSMRSRAFSFAAVYLILLFLNYKTSGKQVKIKINWKYVVLIAVVALAFSWKQLIFYFTTPTQPRAMLLRYSIITLMNYLPIGAGFGTYGSDVAATYYSNLYKQYGFMNRYGMGKANTIYLNDNYWPMIFGQFGIIGTIITAMFIYLIHKEIYESVKGDRFYSLAALSAVIFLGISSVASKSYSEFSTICVFMLLGIMQTKNKSSEVLINE